MVRTKILAMILAVAMIVAIVPAFGIVASAATEFSSVGSAYSVEANLEFDGSYAAVQAPSGATSIGDVYKGWSNQYKKTNDAPSSWDAGNANIGGIQSRTDVPGSATANVIRWQSASGNRNGGGTGDWGNIITPGYGGDKDVIVFEWKNYFSGGNPRYGHIYFYDTKDFQFADMEIDMNGTWYHGKSGVDRSKDWVSNVSGSFYRIVAVNNDDSTYNIYYEANYNGVWVKMYEASNISGHVSGLGRFVINRPQWNHAWDGLMGIVDLKIYAADRAAADITVNYKDGSETVATETYEGKTLGSQIALPEYVVNEKNEYLYSVVDSGSITVSGASVDVTVKKYKKLVKSGDSYNQVINGSFESNGNFDTTGWISAETQDVIPNPTSATQNYFFAVAKDGYYFAGAKHEFGDDNIGDSNNGQVPKTGDPTDGDWYLMGKWGDGYNGLCSIKRSFDLTAGKQYYFSYDTKTIAGMSSGNVVRVGTTANGEELAENSGTAAGVITPEWKTVSRIVDATDEANTLWFRAWKISNVGGSGNDRTANIGFDNFRLYEITDIVDTLEELETPSDITIIEGNKPVLPKTLNGTGTLGSIMENVPITWNEPSDYNETKDYLIEGYATDYEDVKVSLTVTVLPCTDNTLAGDTINAARNQAPDGSAAHTFNAVKGNVTFEFDAKFNALVNSTITLGDSTGHRDGFKSANGTSGNGDYPIFGGDGEAISIQTNAGGLSVRNFPADNDTVNATYPITGIVSTGNTYRFLITTNTDAHTYSVKITDEDGNVLVDKNDINYRRWSINNLDVLVVLDNNNNTDNTITVTNFRVSWTDKNLYKNIAVEYKDGDTVVGTIPTQRYKVGDKIERGAGKAYYDGKIYSYDALDVTVSDETPATITLNAEIEQANAATSMALTAGGDLNVGPGGIYDIGLAGTGKASTKDADGKNLIEGSTQGVTTGREAEIKFNVPDRSENQAIKMYLPVGYFKANATTTDTRMRLIAKIGEKEIYSTNELQDKTNDTTYEPPVTVEFDVTELLADKQAGEEAAISFATSYGVVGFVGLDVAGFGGAKEGYAPYLAVEDGVKVTVEGVADGALITKNGSKVTAPFVAQEGDTVRVYADGTNATPVYVSTNDNKVAGLVATVSAATTTISVAEPGEAKVALGWDETNSEFTINVTADNATAISITPQGGTAVDVALGGNAGIAITPNSTNNVYTVAGKNGSVAGASVQASVYSLVAKALAEGGVDKVAYNGTNWISTKQVLATAKVIADGGIYISGGQLTVATQKVLDYSNGTVTIKQDLYDAGLKFDTNATISAESADGDEISAVVTDARTITITGINGTALESIIYLEDVEFVLEAVGESVADETISGELDFVEEV